MSERRIIHIDTEDNTELQDVFAGYETGDEIVVRVKVVIRSYEPAKGLVGIVKACSEPEGAKKKKIAVMQGTKSNELADENSAALVTLMSGAEMMKPEEADTGTTLEPKPSKKATAARAVQAPAAAVLGL